MYSVCTVTKAETIAIAETIGDGFEPVPVPRPTTAWRPWGTAGGCLLPQDEDTDGMAVFAWRSIG